MGKKGTGEVMTQQQKQRNDAYNAYVEQVTPTHNLWANMGKAFVLGGAICLLGQVITAIAMNVDRKSTRLNSSHTDISRMPSSA